MSAPKEILKLVERFTEHIEDYRSGRYKEEQVCAEFILPMFEALGWDIYNREGYSEAYKEVIHHDSIKAGVHTKAPDYCFRVGGVRKFFLEAKKPSVSIKDEPHPAFQLRRYAWSAKLPLGILTDFEELAVYDCRTKPVTSDKATTSRTLYLTYDQYSARWDEIAGVFSKEAILKGSFDKYVEGTKGRRGTASVDDAFLEEIERWRKLLAQGIAKRNKLGVRELNFAVQAIIDRIIFLRICEDQSFESYGRFMALQNGSNVYGRLLEMFRHADQRYNSGLFHFEEEKGRATPPDTLTPKLKIDDDVLRDIFKNLYYPQSPYEFSVIPTEILGQAYERFLGRVIHLTPTRRVNIEEKPEVRKAGGVYYTPSYIVEYIVKNTVGKLLEGKTPKEAAKLKVLDPACGSGSFLIGAYDLLRKWHLDWYVKHDPDKWTKGRSPTLYKSQKGEWSLTFTEQRRLLTDNLYGVDIDPQAVEVTKLSLLLKLLEGLTQHELFREHALPDLGSNIKCGNSLIGPDFYEGRQMSFLDDEERMRINVFDWNREFSDIMKGGGFDAVIGNPPYVFGRDWKELNISNDVKEYLGHIYKSSPYQLDMFSIFMEKTRNICKDLGYVGLIVPNVWLTNKYSVSTRSFIFNNSSELFIAVPPKNVFPGITVDTVVYTMRKAGIAGKWFHILKIAKDGLHSEVAKYDAAEYKDGTIPISTTLDISSHKLVFKLKEHFPELREFADITRGVHPYRIGGYGKSAFGSGSQTSRDVEERPYHSRTCKKGYRAFIYGRDLQRFMPPIAKEYVNYGSWLAEPRDASYFEGERIYSRKILGERLLVTIETSDSIADQQVYITRPKEGVSALYLAAILGSKLMAYYIRHYFNEVDDAFPQIKVEQLKSLPIKRVKSARDLSEQGKLVKLTKDMLELNVMIASKKTDYERATLQRQIAATDQQIDKLVYALYGLTEEEIKIVESAC